MFYHVENENNTINNCKRQLKRNLFKTWQSIYAPSRLCVIAFSAIRVGCVNSCAYLNGVNIDFNLCTMILNLYVIFFAIGH